MLHSAVPFARIPTPGLHLTVLGLAAAVALSACNESGDKPPQAASAPLPSATESAQPAATPAAYAPPPAETLYQMVAPIALYPDKLVAQVLAASTYPDQVGAAEVWLGQNPGLQPEALQGAVNGQDWDPSVKSLALFPNVLAQLASNIPWTTALGKAYYNDPADVMNAIQVMRQRAYKAGTLRDSSRLKVAVATPDAPSPAPPPAGESLSSMLPVPVIDTPPQFIEISPAQPDTVYVPQYDPGVVYGEPLPVYGGYRPIVAPQPVVVGSTATPLVTGLIGFGAGVVLAEAVDRRPWGWNSWGMRWGEPGYRWHRNEPPPPPSRRPAVVYNNNTYVSRSTTVVQNIHNTNVSYIANDGRRDPRHDDHRPQGGDPRSGAMAAAALAGAAGMAGAAHMAGTAGPAPGMPHRLGLRPPQGGPAGSAQGMLAPGTAQGFAQHDGMDRGHPGLRPDDRPQARLQPRMAPVPASQPGQFGQAGKWPQSPEPGVTQRPAPAIPAAAQAGERGRDARLPSWSSAATRQGMRSQDRQDHGSSMADAARMRQQQQQMEMQTARLRGEEQARQRQAQRQAQMQAQARDQAREQAQMQARQQAERDRQAFQQRAQDQARQQQLQQQQQQARAQQQMQARMQAQQQAQQQAQRQAQMQDRQAQQQRQQQFEAAQQQRMANASRPQERRGGRDERRDR
ncbi:Transcription initiation factor TFIID, subunit TAF12 (also component of histone acetyltransferase SAGA) [Delftia tsuruhatensis]|uniref:DUF3300 domain-containing protein n=1 Tax=Delftia tsuruhatensis TaxID=180282 RepID=UPI001E6CEF3D|nr:DUF3300 domain-containing protein [Delftia tsuruhatensis]CAB5721376.1 Transcription initiation factor TFIID, subunit TAF12 (also component of histone acetyltransferase SAGA) [Delftia tsuruhatensis]CAC9688397.1 Transcription initiation factor TFIID, subunit TAF12 (also component of histone acetyltransferase SAGA) [Delftia tsuruhatensis]